MEPWPRAELRRVREGNGGEEQQEDYRENRYHQPADEFDLAWDFSGLAKLVRFGFELGRRVADQPELPTWVEGDEFLATRQSSQSDP